MNTSNCCFQPAAKIILLWSFSTSISINYPFKPNVIVSCVFGTVCCFGQHTHCVWVSEYSSDTVVFWNTSTMYGMTRLLHFLLFLNFFPHVSLWVHVFELLSFSLFHLTHCWSHFWSQQSKALTPTPPNREVLCIFQVHNSIPHHNQVTVTFNCNENYIYILS